MLIVFAKLFSYEWQIDNKAISLFLRVYNIPLPQKES